jgi:L-histidine Nalpha-methyltransferase
MPSPFTHSPFTHAGGASGRDDTRAGRAVRDGLLRPDKELPTWLLYDEEGSRLYELITELPEYYPCRIERSILEEHADAIVEAAAAGSDQAISVAELGAGTASKSQLVVSAAVRRQGRTTFMPGDISGAALRIATARLRREEPQVRVWPVLADHESVLDASRALPGRQLLLFMGSSIGNYDDEAAARLLCAARASLREGGVLLLGTDLRKSPAVLVRAYDDAQGITARFNKNLLTRINRELGGRFDLTLFRHVAVWNAGASRIEMHLESTMDQAVRIEALGIDVRFRMGERIHTESSLKYDEAMVDALLGVSGFHRERTFVDRDRMFAVHLARASVPVTPRAS